MKVLLLDNFDSFTYNLYHYLRTLGAEVEVCRNDQSIFPLKGDVSHVMISPGPGLPAMAGCTMELIAKAWGKLPILGVCLGCQALAEFVGGRLYNQQEVAHGIERKASREGKSWLLNGLPDSFPVGLYHSWAIENSEQLNQEFKVVAWRDGKIPMAMEHHRLPIAGVQFHPESIMSEGGMEILANWLKRA